MQRLLDKGINYMAADKEDNIWIGAGNTYTDVILRLLL